MVPRLYADRGARATDDLAISLLQGRCVGGSTTVNWMIMLRTQDWVLDEWSAEHGTEGMNPADLRPVFDLVEHEVHARIVPRCHAPNNRIILDGAGRLGWPARVQDQRERLHSRGISRHRCRYGAKQSTLVTYVPRALAAGARLTVTCAFERVEQIERGGIAPLKRVRATVLDRTTGERRHSLTVAAPIVVLAAGAVGTRQPAAVGVWWWRSGQISPPAPDVGGDRCLRSRDVWTPPEIHSPRCQTNFKRDSTAVTDLDRVPRASARVRVGRRAGFRRREHRRVSRNFRISKHHRLVRDGAERRHSDGERARRSPRTCSHPVPARRPTASTLSAGLAAAARLHFAASATESLRCTRRACVEFRSGT